MDESKRLLNGVFDESNVLHEQRWTHQVDATIREEHQDHDFTMRYAQS